MRWQAIVVAIVMLATVGFAATDTVSKVQAQEATPCALWPQQDPAITSFEVGQFMQWPSTILVEFAPGASTPGDDGKLGAQLINLVYVQSGAFTLQTEIPMAIHRGGLNGTPEVVPAGTTFMVEAGDYYVTGPIMPSMRNDGPNPASYQLSRVNPEPTVIDRCAPLG